MSGKPPVVVKRILQVCVVVPSLSKALEALVASGFGPFKVWRFESPRLFNQNIYGRRADGRIDLALAWCGDVQLEVVQPSGRTPAAEWLAHNGPGLQHVMVETTKGYRGAKRTYDKLGFPVLHEAAVVSPVKVGKAVVPSMPGALRAAFCTRFAYLDTAEKMGTTLELVKFPPGISFRRGNRLAVPDRWAGAEPDSMHHWERHGRPRIKGVSLGCDSLALATTKWRHMLDHPIQVGNKVAGVDVGGTHLELFKGTPGESGLIASVPEMLDLRETAGLLIRPKPR